MYLGHDEYEAMGGTLDSSAFFIYSRRAEYMIRSQAGGQTGERIDNLSEIPEAVKDCIFDLVSFLSNYAGDKQVASESQSQGGTKAILTLQKQTRKYLKGVEKSWDNISTAAV